MIVPLLVAVFLLNSACKSREGSISETKHDDAPRSYEYLDHLVQNGIYYPTGRNAEGIAKFCSFKIRIASSDYPAMISATPVENMPSATYCVPLEFECAFEISDPCNGHAMAGEKNDTSHICEMKTINEKGFVLTCTDYKLGDPTGNVAFRLSQTQR